MCGIGLLDVSLRRFDYSSGVRDQVYGRMIAERKAAAMRLLSEGEGQGSEISGRMEKELKEICQRP
jgi:regulator of protease activity HflC (stomatin/prohibitin superfamily)